MTKIILSITLHALLLATSASSILAAQRQLSIADVGAIADGTTLNTESIQSAVDQLAAEGGGTVVIPQGVFASGAIFLKPGVNLHLDEGAVLKGTTDMEHYPRMPIRIEGHFEENYSAGLINAEGCDNLKITGKGTLDGSGRPIWNHFWKLRKQAKDRKNFRNLSIPRAQLCIINNSKNITIDGITFKDSQYWNLHPYNCTNVVIKNASFVVPDNYKQAPSTDGIDIDSCQDVVIKDCYFSVTDDCIAMKGTWGPLAHQDTKSQPVERVSISNCTFRRGHAAITCGSDASVARDLTVTNCRVTGAMSLLCLKLRSDTPQTYENILLSEIQLDNPGGTLLKIEPWTQYINLRDQQPPKSTVQNVTLTQITGRYGEFGVIRPNPGQTAISDITLKDLDLKLRRGRLAADDSIENLRFENVRINGKILP